MLVLSRKKGDSIFINDDIEIVILDISGDQVKIGINAPKNISIYRDEIFKQIKEANKSSILEIDIKQINQLFKKNQ